MGSIRSQRNNGWLRRSLLFNDGSQQALTVRIAVVLQLKIT